MGYKVFIRNLSILLGLLLLYNNCSPHWTKQSSTESSVALSSASSTGGVCDDALQTLFASGYHQFTKTTCNGCHVNGPGKGKFADPDVSIAFADFMQIGYAKVSNNAVSDTHQPPTTGPQNSTVINNLRLEWEKGQVEYNTCKGASSGATSSAADALPIDQIVTLETFQKQVPAMAYGETKEMIWNIDSEMNIISNRVPALPVIPSAKFSVMITKAKTSGGNSYYAFDKPTLFGSTADVHLKGIHVKINGRLQFYPTTFRFVDTKIRAGSLDDLSGRLSIGSLVAPGVLFDQDMISMAFELIEPIVLPPPAPATEINFGAVTTRTDPKTNKKYADVEVLMGSGLNGVALVNVIEDGSNVCGTGANLVLSASCLPAVFTQLCGGGKTCVATDTAFGRARSVAGTVFNVFNWDYRFTGSTLTFSTGETKKIISVELSTDIRREGNRLLTLQLQTTSFGETKLGSKSQLNIPILKINNPVPDLTPNAAGVPPTFSALMDPNNGILGKNCVVCHNSRDLNGGYDMTDYQLMISRGVLVPGSPTSKMFQRMNSDDPANYNLSPMPNKPGWLDLPLIKKVEAWILSGAKNN